MTPELIHRRRWAILAVLVPQRVPRGGRQHDRQRGAAHAQPRARRHHQPAAVDRRRLHPGVRRAAAGVRQPRRPLRPQGRAADRSGAVRRHLGAGRRSPAPPSELIAARAAMGIGAALVFPATLAILTNVFTEPTRAGQGHRRLVGGHRPGRRARPGHRRLAARALLVGLDLPGQRPDRRRRPGRWARGWCPTSRDPDAGRLDPVGLVTLHRRDRAARVHRDRGAAQGWTSADDHRRVRRRPRALLAAFVWWERRRRDPMLDVTRVPQPPVLRRQLRRWPSPSSACSASSSSITQYFQFVRGYSTLVGRPAHAALRRRRRHRRADRRPAGAAVRHEAGRRRRARVDVDRVLLGLDAARPTRRTGRWSCPRWCSSPPA